MYLFERIGHLKSQKITFCVQKLSHANIVNLNTELNATLLQEFIKGPFTNSYAK